MVTVEEKTSQLCYDLGKQGEILVEGDYPAQVL